MPLPICRYNHRLKNCVGDFDCQNCEQYADYRDELQSAKEEDYDGPDPDYDEDE
jgi:hypothetical protein